MKDKGLPMLFSTIFLFLVVGFVLFVPISILKYRNRAQLADFYVALPDAKKAQVISLSKKFVAVSRIVLWLSPLYLVLIPAILFYYLQIDLMLSIIFMALLCTTIWLEFAFRSWVIRSLSVNKELH